MPDAEIVLRRLRAICMKLLGAEEIVTWGHPTFRVDKKIFAVLEEYKGDLCIVFKTEKEHQPLFLKDARFFIAPYVGKHGWLSLKVGGRVNWTEVRHLVRDSHRLVSAAFEGKGQKAKGKRQK
jgi:predicted DNA-binding protein (MmcQ/YjbR family)